MKRSKLRSLPTLRGGSRLVVIGLLLTACHGDPPPPLYTGPGSSDPEPEPVAETEAPSAERALWFADGPGLDAMIARERRDHATTVAKLDELLADASTSAEDRAVAQLLRALEDVEAELYASAADRFAEARTSPALGAIDVWLRAREAQARLDASQPDRALALIRDVEPTPGLAESMLVMQADALKRTDATDQALERYRSYLKKYPKGARRHEARMKLAEMHIEAGRFDEAVGLYERVLLDVPLSNYGHDAQQGLARLEREKKVKRDAKHVRGFDRDLDLARMRARLGRRAYEKVVRQADKFTQRKDISAAQKCEAMYLKASAVFKQRQRTKARPLYEKAAKQCQTAGSNNEVVKSKYQAARGQYAQGQYSGAARAFEKMAADHAKHSYSDDAWIKAGESWEEAGEAVKARKAYRTALDAKYRGDMANEARRRLLVQAFAEKRHDDALALADSSLAAGVNHRRERAKLHYFRGRALAELGKPDEAQAAWLDAIEQMPLSYPAVQSLSRLREQSEGALKKGMTVLSAEVGNAANLDLPADPSVERARLFARLGLGEEAQRELDDAKVDGWPAAALLSSAGLYDEVQRKLANLGLDWRQAPPVGSAKPMWEIAHPRPFTEIIDPGEKEYGVPPLLTFAIMQTESRFDPGATSWAGARGLVQLMPSTAKSVAQKAGVELDGQDALYDPATNLGLGMRYLAGLTRRWGGGDAGPALAIPSYNAGAGSVDKWVAERGDWPLDLFIESIPYDETRKYTQKVLERWAIYRWMYAEGEPAQRLVYLPPQVPKRAR